jgi:hydroxymethylbilane synthase
MVALPDGSRLVRGRTAGEADRAEEVGRRLADALLAQGAGEILKEIDA